VLPLLGEVVLLLITPLLGGVLLFLFLLFVFPMLLFDLELLGLTEGATLLDWVLLLSVVGFTALLAAGLDVGVLLSLRASDLTLEFLVVALLVDLTFVRLFKVDRVLPYSFALTYFFGLELTAFLDEDLAETCGLYTLIVLFPTEVLPGLLPCRTSKTGTLRLVTCCNSERLGPAMYLLLLWI
jgi:hypothetical protein